MKSYLFNVILSVPLCMSCSDKDTKTAMEMEIRAVEEEFMVMASQKGIKEAFIHFADENAVIIRNDMVFQGKEGIASYFDNQSLMNVSLCWAPDFIGISSCGDMAYTYGNYLFKATSQDGQSIESRGIFHTVWKRQRDGSWKYVYD